MTGCGLGDSPDLPAGDDSGNQVIRFNKKFFPDEEFREEMKWIADADDNDILSEEEAAAVTELEFDFCSFEDVTGLEYFTNLKMLKMAYANLTSFDLRNYPSLEWVRLMFLGDLKSVNLGGPALKEFSVLDCHELTEIDAQEASALEVIALTSCGVTSLDLSKNTALTTVELKEIDSLTGMVDLSANKALNYVICQKNDSVEGLILPQNLSSDFSMYIDDGLTVEKR